MDVLWLLVYLLVIYIGYKTFFWILRIPRIPNLESRYILITGCDTGFGNALAKKLDSMGCQVIATCYTETGETELRKVSSKNVRVVHLNITKPESIQRTFEDVKAILPKGVGLWGLVNNAGILHSSMVVTWDSMDMWHKMFAVNLFGQVEMTLKFLPLLKLARGRIVNTASILGRCAAVSAPYDSTKYAFEAFSDHLRRHLKDFGVCVSIVEPDLHETPLGTELGAHTLQAYKNLPRDLQEEYGAVYLQNVCSTWQEAADKVIHHDTSLVADAYTHGLLGRFPRARYLVGSTNWQYLLIHALPEWLGDPIFKSIRNPGKPAVCQK